MSYDLYIVTGDKQVESVFNCSVFNMRPFIAANIKVLSNQLRIMESRRRVAKNHLSQARKPQYVQGEPNSGIVDKSDITYYTNVVQDLDDQIRDIERSIEAWVGLEQNEEVSYLNLCLLFSFDIEEDYLEENEERYAREMMRSLIDCARFHGDVQAYYA